MDFAEWKAGTPARSMFRKLGIIEILEQSQGWTMLRALVVHFNDPDIGHFVNRVRKCDGVCSGGERIMLHAICYACDFAWLADELMRGQKGDPPRVGSVWRAMHRASGEWGRAVAACIEAWS